MRERQKKEEIEAGDEAAERLHLEIMSEAKAEVLQEEEKKEYAQFVAEQKHIQEKDHNLARKVHYLEKEDEWLRDYNRENANYNAEVKGDRALKKIQARELKSIHSDYKTLRTQYKKAKFHPIRTPVGVKLGLKLDNILTTSLSVDQRMQELIVEVEAEVPEIPVTLMDYVGDLNFKPIRFLAHLNFGVDCMEWDKLRVSHKYDKENSYLSILIESVDGDNAWVRKTDIYAAYKNRSWFW